MKRKLTFFLNFLKHPLKNASVIPSSRYAAEAMIDGIDFSSINTIVEFGPGEGVVTEQILKKCKKNTKIILFEIEKSYMNILKSQFGHRAIVVNACASKLNEVLKKNRISKVDLIVSGLPFLPQEIKAKVFRAIRKQTDKGAIFRYFTFMPFIMKKVYKGMPIRKISFVLRNIPPIHVFGIN